jgi:hypothetical protein
MAGGEALRQETNRQGRHATCFTHRQETRARQDQPALHGILHEQRHLAVQTFTPQAALSVLAGCLTERHAASSFIQRATAVEIEREGPSRAAKKERKKDRKRPFSDAGAVAPPAACSKAIRASRRLWRVVYDDEEVFRV